MIQLSKGHRRAKQKVIKFSSTLIKIARLQVEAHHCVVWYEILSNALTLFVHFKVGHTFLAFKNFLFLNCVTNGKLFLLRGISKQISQISAKDDIYTQSGDILNLATQQSFDLSLLLLPTNVSVYCDCFERKTINIKLTLNITAIFQSRHRLCLAKKEQPKKTFGFVWYANCYVFDANISIA